MLESRSSAVATIFSACLMIGAATFQAVPAFAQDTHVYRGPIRFPDFKGRDHAYATYRTRIINEMRTGPNFAGRMAIIEVGCGAGCRFVFAADVPSGKVYEFPYGGEDYYMMDLKYGVKDRYVEAKWISDDKCVRDTLAWNGVRFLSTNKKIIGPSELCSL